VPVAQPEPETAPDEVQRPDVSAEAGAEANQPEQQATAPEAASDRVETEANRDETADAGGAPTRSTRPATRPNRRAAAQERTPEQDSTQDAVADALAEALASSLGGAQQAAPEPAGPPLTAGEKDALRVAVSRCWNVGSVSSEALRTTVVVAVSMGREGRPSANSIRMVSSSGGSSEAAKKAFEAARRAIIRCGTKGYDLPAEKYSQWRDIEITFNPERMRIK
jgi:vancomycin resistance protein YoaR